MRMSPSPRSRTTLGLGLVLALAPALVQAPAVAGQDDGKKRGWISLFNGKDLEGWTPKITGYPAGENYGDTFRVEDGVLKVSYAKYPKFDGKFGHLFSKQKFSHYRLRVEYRFVGDQCPGGPGWAYRNSGVMIHCQPVETMRVDQEFPVSIEVQFLGGDGKKERATANACTPGTNVVVDGRLVKAHTIESRAGTYHGDRWVTVEVEVHGGEAIRHVVDGETVLEYEKPQYDERDADARKLIRDGGLRLGEGFIALQAESHPVEFRKVEILPLEE
jgi:3-keto-disaccharide hydrolase